jgi:hypothetical protein
MLPPGTAEKFLLAGLSSLRAIMAKGAEHLMTMYSLTEQDAKGLLEYAKKREEELVVERAAAAAQAVQLAALAKVAASATPECEIIVDAGLAESAALAVPATPATPAAPAAPAAAAETEGGPQ